MTLTYRAKFGFVSLKTDIGIQKINSLALIIYKIVLASFSVKDKLEKIWFLNKTFLLVNSSKKIVLEIFFLDFSNTNV